MNIRASLPCLQIGKSISPPHKAVVNIHLFPVFTSYCVTVMEERETRAVTTSDR